jgi:hypothetical protein
VCIENGTLSISLSLSLVLETNYAQARTANIYHLYLGFSLQSIQANTNIVLSIMPSERLFFTFQFHMIHISITMHIAPLNNLQINNLLTRKDSSPVKSNNAIKLVALHMTTSDKQLAEIKIKLDTHLRSITYVY